MKPVIQNKSKPNQIDKIQIFKNKEIVIYKNGEEFKRFRQSEEKELNEDEMYILDFLLKKYSGFEVPPRFSKIENEFEFESTEDFFKKRQGKKNNEISEEESKKTEPKLKEFFKDIEDENGEEVEDDIGREEITEIKKLKKGIKIQEDQKVPIKKKNKEMNYHYEEENIDIENEEEEESEDTPQYIIEVESYTSPSFKYVDKKKAEEAILNGINISLMINGEEKKGIIFLGKNEKIIFVLFEDKKETIISLNNIKRIYFNIKGSLNLRNYKKKDDNERFIQFVEYNNQKTDFKFDKNEDLEYFIKGLIQTFKNKSTPIEKKIIYEKYNKYFTYNNKKDNEDSYNNLKEKSITLDKTQKNSYRTNKFEKPSYSYKKRNENKEYYKNENNYINQKNNKYNQNNYNKENNNDDEDNLITTTVTEVYKGGKLINEETKEESRGVVKTLHSYSPDINEYEEYLRKSKFRKRNITDEDLNKSIERVHEVNKYNRGYY